MSYRQQWAVIQYVRSECRSPPAFVKLIFVQVKAIQLLGRVSEHGVDVDLDTLYQSTHAALFPKHEAPDQGRERLMSSIFRGLQIVLLKASRDLQPRSRSKMNRMPTAMEVFMNKILNQMVTRAQR